MCVCVCVCVCVCGVLFYVCLYTECVSVFAYNSVGVHSVVSTCA